MTLAIVERAFPVDPSGLLPAVTPDNAPFWNALAEGRMLLQRCAGCQRMRYPVAPVCPYCSHGRSAWESISGRGRVFSWVRYHRSYLPEFVDVMPYFVLCAQLDEGPRMFGRLAGKVDRSASLNIGTRVHVVIERWPGGRCVPAFTTQGEG